MTGVERADSIAWNLHKMLCAPLQSSVFITRHKELLHHVSQHETEAEPNTFSLLLQTNSASATYLFQQDKFYDVTWDTGDKSVQCGRKVDGFKTWFMVRARGEDDMKMTRRAQTILKKKMMYSNRAGDTYIHLQALP